MYKKIEQLSPEWWAVKVGKVSGTRFGQLISGRENMLVDELANEIMDGFIEQDDFVTEDMQFGIENEPIAIDMYEKKIGMKFKRGGVMLSDIHPNLHMASPDAISEDETIVVEVKCTTHGKTQLNRFRKGVDSKYIPQIINYFAVNENIKEVHWISYCPFRPERPLVVVIITRDTEIERKETKSRGLEITTIQDKVNEGLSKLPELKEEVQTLITNFKF
jgi:hypothetical protein